MRRHAHKDGEVLKVGWGWPLFIGTGMVFVTLAIYWCWICVEFNQGKMLLPESFAPAAIASWWTTSVWGPIVKHCVPSTEAWVLYLGWTAWQAVLFSFAPGPVGEGSLLPDGKSRLKYKFNGQFAWFVTLIVVFTAHFTGVYKLTNVARLFPELLTVCNIWTAAVILALYVYALATKSVFRPSDSFVYDYFMGPILNPRIGSFDIKFFFELRPGIMQWFFTTVAFALKMREDYGTISTPMLLICFYHLCFVNACYKGEACVVHSMDIIYEKLGWMLLQLDLIMVPFIFPLQAYYLYKIGPFEHHWAVTTLLLALHCFGYYLFDTANAQKDYFRAKGDFIEPGFPHLPWSRLENPKFLETKRGTKLLLDGWWKYGRHLNYTGDILMSWVWGLTCGVGSYFPFAYTTYLTPLLLHRERRDDRECAAKYGADWDEYKRRVPYRLIPYIY